MYLVKTKSGNRIIDTVNEVKEIDKNEILEIYFLSKVDYDSLVSTGDVRDCITEHLNKQSGRQDNRESIIEHVAEILGVKKSVVSKVITAMKREKILYVVEEDGYLGIN